MTVDRPQVLDGIWHGDMHFCVTLGTTEAAAFKWHSQATLALFDFRFLSKEQFQKMAGVWN